MNYVNSSVMNNNCNQHTLKRKVHFSGVGVHNGRAVSMIIEPAQIDTGIVFQRIDFNENNTITKMHLILFKFKYVSSRILDIIVTILITDSLITIFANRNYFLFPIRKFSFLLLNNFIFIRKLVLNQMTKSLIYSSIR